MWRCMSLAVLGMALVATGAPADEKAYVFRESESFHALQPDEQKALEQVDHDFALLNEALEKYAQAHEGQVPKRLEDLVPRHLKELPKDPFATKITAAEKELGNYTPSLEGWGYRYRPGIGDAFILASVGLPDFPYRAVRGGGLYHAKGTWISGNQLVPVK